MELLGGNAYLCPKTEHISVGEPGGAVYINRCCVNTLLELCCGKKAFGDDTFGMACGKSLDVLQCLSEVVNDPYCDDIIKELCCIVVLVGRSYVFPAKDICGHLVAPDLHIVLVKTGFKHRQELFRHAFMHKAGLNGVAHAGS